jgi:hypothetical protein
MNASECNSRALECAANAAMAPGETLAREFLKLAAQWRAMAIRESYLGHVGEGAPPDAALLRTSKIRDAKRA